MIDIATETLLSLGQATKYIPRRRGKKVYAATVWRWMNVGKAGVKLEGLKTPAGWFTSVEALQRFFERLASGYAAPTTAGQLNFEARQARARAVLERMGIPVAAPKQ